MDFVCASLQDMEELVRLRIAYLRTDGGVDAREEEELRQSLPAYFEEHLNRDCFVYAAKDGEKMVATVYLNVSNKPPRPSCKTGDFGIAYNVYTMPEYRRRGLARKLMLWLLDEAREKKLNYVALEATAEGYPVYMGIGFVETVDEYRQMHIDL